MGSNPIFGNTLGHERGGSGGGAMTRVDQNALARALAG
jgi:hypothetical protein